MTCARSNITNPREMRSARLSPGTMGMRLQRLRHSSPTALTFDGRSR